MAGEITVRVKILTFHGIEECVDCGALYSILVSYPGRDAIACPACGSTDGEFLEGLAYAVAVESVTGGG